MSASSRNHRTSYLVPEPDDDGGMIRPDPVLPGTEPTTTAPGDDAGPVSPTFAQEVSYVNALNPDGTATSTSYWGSTGRTANKWGPSTAGTGATISYFFDSTSAFTATEQTTVLRAFAMWSSVANVTFTAAGSSAAANVLLQRGSDGRAYETGATSTASGATLGSHTDQARISIDTSGAGFDLSGNLNTVGGYGQSTIIHEVGHLLGLGHEGPYNGNVNPATQQYSAYDERMWTLMSYIYWRNSGTAQYGGSYPVTGTNWGVSPDGYYRSAPHTVMQGDILAIQQLYGAAPSSQTQFTGGQVFGFNSNVTGLLSGLYDFSNNTAPVVTLYDQGTNNTLDLSGFSQGATVNLTAGAFSSASGLTNNIAIAQGTVIETAIGGAGNDRLTGNSANNTLTGNGGNDTIDGGAGIDTATFNVARSAATIARTGNGTYTVAASGFTDTLTSIERLRFTDRTVNLAGTVADDLNGDGTSDLLLQSGGSVRNWTISNTAVANNTLITNGATGFTVRGTGDFNGDGTADILLQNGGTVVDWIMGNGQYQSGNNITDGAAGYTIRAIGDFDGDGTDDIVLQNGSSVVEWTMRNGRYQSGRLLGDAGGFTVVGAGDFNGDGTDDLVLQSGGTIITWQLVNGAYQSGRVITNGATGYTVVGTGDFNGDRTDDMLLQNNGTVVDW
ncbi:FG-GAP-like repeat-containing protein, partial [Methylobacterium trifolii]|uniref:FG-GAP-like repeat-containing protein n=1 Tax=Methylobacterium trifolii TaxID=1003092 RepID=UPI001EDFB839